MPEEETTTEVVETATKTTEEKPADQASDADSGENEKDLPEWARKKLTKANTEAANYRTQLRDAEAKLTEAKTPEQHEAALTELRSQITKLETATMKSEAARKAKLPDELVGRLVGNTAEELEADAKLLAGLVVSGSTSGSRRAPSGGLNPSDSDSGSNDPLKLALAARAARN